jgi:hypothetical protein
MELIRMLSNASLMGRLSLLVTPLPLVAGLAYLVRPTERQLALMRPISLAGIFAALGGTAIGVMNVLKSYAVNEPPPPVRILALGTAEALVPLFVASGCLTVAWLCVAVGMRRQA